MACTWRRAAAGLTVVSALAGVVGCGRGDDGDPPGGAGAASTAPPPTVAAGVPGEWRELAESPLGPRAGAVAVWTGEEVVVVGGRHEPGCGLDPLCETGDPVPRRDGAAYDPAHDTWRTIAEAPVPIELGPAVVDGDAYFLSRSPAAPEVLRYDPEGDAWERIEVPDPAASYLLTATGDTLVLYQPTEPGGRPDLTYDPASDTWDELPAAPLSPGYDRTMVGTDDAVVLLDHEVVDRPGADPLRALLYDPAGESWERLPDGDVRTASPWLATGDLLVNPQLGLGHTDGGILDLGGDAPEWRPVPVPPDGGAALAGALGGDSAVYTGLDGYALDVGSGEWARVPELPGGYASALAPVGRDLFVYGGLAPVTDPADSTDAEVLAGAWAWTAPPAG